MGDVFIIEAVRSPLGRRGGGLSTVHPAELLGAIMAAAVQRAGIDAAEVDQVVAGCVTQVGEQAFNVARTAWLSAGLPLEVPSTTVDSQCGSSQQATTLAAGLVGSGLEDIVLSCGVESMSRLPLGASFADKKLGRPIPNLARDRQQLPTGQSRTQHPHQLGISHSGPPRIYRRPGTATQARGG